LDLWLLSFQVTATSNGTLLSWKWINTCLLMEVVNEFLILFCLCAAFAYLLNCLYLNPRVFSLLALRFSPMSCWQRANEQLCRAELLARVKPQYMQTFKTDQKARITFLNAAPFASNFLVHFSCSSLTKGVSKNQPNSLNLYS